jgi:hypothetical protein
MKKADNSNSNLGKFGYDVVIPPPESIGRK